MRSLRVLHVRLDEPGGGVVYVRLAMTSGIPGVDMEEITLDPDRLRASPVGWWRSAHAVRTAIRARGINLVHVQGARAAVAVVLGSIGLDVARVVMLQGLHSVRRAQGWSAPLVAVLNRVVLGRFDRVMVVSESDRDAVVKLGISRQKVRLIRTSFEASALRRSDSMTDKVEEMGPGPVIAWVGRFDRQKDPETFVRAFPLLRHRNVTGLMIGDGPLRRLVDDLVRSLDSNIVLTGWLDDPGSGYASADAFVSTARWEGLPVAVLEAAAAGLPLVLSECPGNQDLVAGGVPALTFAPGDHVALAACIDDLVAAPEVARSRGEKGRSVVLETYNLENMLADLSNVYAEIR